MFKCYSGMSNVFLNNTLFSGSQYTFLPFSSIATSTLPIDVEMGCGYMVTTLEREERRNMRSGTIYTWREKVFFFFFAVFQVLLALTVGTRVMITSCQGSFLKSRGEGWMPHVVSVSHAGEGDIRSIGFTFIRLTLASSNLVTFIICLETKEGVGHFHKTKSRRNKAWLRMSRGERLLPILAPHPLEGHCCANQWFFQVWYVPNRKPECERTLGLWIVQRVPVKNEMEEL